MKDDETQGPKGFHNVELNVDSWLIHPPYEEDVPFNREESRVYLIRKPLP